MALKVRSLDQQEQQHLGNLLEMQMFWKKYSKNNVKKKKEMQILSLQLRPTESEALPVRPKICVSTSPPGQIHSSWRNTALQYGGNLMALGN